VEEAILNAPLRFLLASKHVRAMASGLPGIPELLALVSLHFMCCEITESSGATPP
jgi:hypothetical protein